MNCKYNAVAAIAAFSLVASLAHADGLLGKRYIEVGVGTDSDAEDFGFDLGYHMPIKADKIDLGIVVGRDEDGVVETALVDFTFYGPTAAGSKTQMFIAPIVGYFQVDTGNWWSGNVSDFVYGVSVGTEYELDEKSNITTSLSYLDSEDYGDFGVTLNVGYDYWFTESFNGEATIGYNTESEDVSFSVSARWAF